MATGEAVAALASNLPPALPPAHSGAMAHVHDYSVPSSCIHARAYTRAWKCAQASEHTNTHTSAGFGAVEHDIGALRNERTMSRAAAAAPAAPLPSSMGRASPEPVMGGGGGIEIPAFLRRRRLQGK
eukprot:1149776-Pelagomonas_calceolata.AAC.1